jgi:hypothetical protein
LTIRAATVAIAAALLVAGCGGSSDEQQIRDVYGSYSAAVRAGNTAKMCSLFVPRIRRDLPGGVAHLFEGPPEHRRQPPKFSSCAEAMHEILPLLKARHPELGEITVQGDRATARLLGRTWIFDRPDAGARPPEASFEKVSGEWKLVAS